MSSSQLSNSMMFQRGRYIPPTSKRMLTVSKSKVYTFPFAVTSIGNMFESCWLAIERMWAVHGCTICILFEFSMDWLKGKSTGKPHDLHGKIDGFRLRLSRENQVSVWNSEGYCQLIHCAGLVVPDSEQFFWIQRYPSHHGFPYSTGLTWITRSTPETPEPPSLKSLGNTFQKQTKFRKYTEYTVSNSSFGVEHGQICVVMFQVLEIRTTAWNQNHSVGIDTDCPHGCNTASDHSATGLEPSIRLSGAKLPRLYPLDPSGELT